MEHTSALCNSLDEAWKRFSALWKETRAKASESRVHDLRVAARRLQARLVLMGSLLDDDEVSAAKKRVRKALKRLGPLRDIHVQIDMIGRFPDSPVAVDFRRERKRSGTRELAKVGRYLRRARRQRIKDAIKGLRQGIERLAEQPRDVSILESVNREAVTRWEKYVNARTAFDSGAEGSLHPMRIALKKLRYVAEVAQETVGGWDERTLNRMQSAQRLMGATHDIEVLMSEFRSWAERQGRQAEADGILKKMERKRSRLLKRIARSARAFDGAIPKEPIIPVREITLAGLPHAADLRSAVPL